MLRERKEGGKEHGNQSDLRVPRRSGIRLYLGTCETAAHVVNRLPGCRNLREDHFLQGNFLVDGCAGETGGLPCRQTENQKDDSDRNECGRNK